MDDTKDLRAKVVPLELESDSLAESKAAIQSLLDLCAENEVDIPEELRHQIARGVREIETIEQCVVTTQTDLLVAKQEERRSSVHQIELHTQLTELFRKLQANPPDFSLRVRDGSYTITQFFESDPNQTSTNDPENQDNKRVRQKIKTVRTESYVYKLVHCLYKLVRCKQQQYKQERIIMENVNLALEPGKMYLVLGAPGCGKSTLLKMIANTLYQKRGTHVVGGEVSIGGLTPSDNVYWSNLVSYIDQIDRLHPYLTVQETCEFSWKCRTGGTHRQVFHGKTPEIDKIIETMDKEMTAVNKILEILGLSRVKDTFVGDQTTVRGVSGGEKKRVTVAEMMALVTPVICCDEISTGLDAATTFDITRFMAAATRIKKSISIVSLLQPPPETVANFDELIFLSGGKIIYCGPVEDVICYFNRLGYEIPDRMDLADWLQILPTKDGSNYLKAIDLDKAVSEQHLTPDQFHRKYLESEIGKVLVDKVNSPVEDDSSGVIREMASRRFRTSAFKALQLVASRELLLWWRDKYAIKAKVIQVLLVGTVVGTLFFQQGGQNAQSIMGVLFQSMFFCSVSAMIVVFQQFSNRPIFYKQQDANFFPAWTYVFGSSISSIPTGLLDALVYGSLVYFLVGLAINDGASIVNYIIFVLVLFVVSWTTGLFFSVYATCIESVTTTQAAMAVTIVFCILFSGFTVQPNVIPNYYIWIYWVNYFSWTFRGLAVNEFASGRYDQLINATTGEQISEGEAILNQYGFVDKNGEPYTFEWAGWGILFALFCSVVACLISVIALTHIRFASGKSLVSGVIDSDDDDKGDENGNDSEVAIPFQRVTLTFKDIHYFVKASTTDEKLELLKGIDGVIEAGKMTALMGSSGAGKTTLMCVLALRKRTGEVTGEVTLNGHPQEESSFRRCHGFVEQFDVQSPQLTIRETCEFSAKLRLEEKDPAVTPESIAMFVDQVLRMLELTVIQDLQVGSDASGGLSFEQRKRLSIAVELVANPSVLFLDEPTSGLDARAAAIVMRGLKRISQSGRAVCATIHQPSIAIFNVFDELLLLKQGGETVFFGPLGENSSNLIHYLERYDATQKIKPGENPASWMLTVIGAGSAATAKAFDYAGNYSASKLHKNCLDRIEKVIDCATRENRITFSSPYATSEKVQALAVLSRVFLIYFRSPHYNVTRVMVSALVGLLFGSVYASERVPTSESDMNSRINSIFIAVFFLCVSSQNSVLNVFEIERNMFYSHKEVKMYSAQSMILAFTVAEIPFLLLTTFVFTVIFYFIMGFSTEADKFFLFFLFVLLAFSIFTMTGQMLVSILKDSATAQGVGGLFVTLTSLFSGILIRPDEIPPFWIFMYWLMPGHYIFEGLFMSQFHDDQTLITASPGSPFYQSLNCIGNDCTGTIADWMKFSFPDFSYDHIKWCILYLACAIVIFRILSFVALNRLNYKPS